MKQKYPRDNGHFPSGLDFFSTELPRRQAEDWQGKDKLWRFRCLAQWAVFILPANSILFLFLLIARWNPKSYSTSSAPLTPNIRIKITKVTISSLKPCSISNPVAYVKGKRTRTYPGANPHPGDLLMVVKLVATKLLPCSRIIPLTTSTSHLSRLIISSRSHKILSNWQCSVLSSHQTRLRVSTTARWLKLWL